MMQTIKKTFINSDGTRKVEIFKRDDSSFGFEDLKFGKEEGQWFPIGRYSIAIIDSLDNAIREAQGRISWWRAKPNRMHGLGRVLSSLC